mmetsp:Transcript_40124/g.116026  ORF Transcript_40124/g.116026 Transcript_40124/m.116026 type:complete len:260 (-) Transcript_40124:704-1483(-)
MVLLAEALRGAQQVFPRDHPAHRVVLPQNGQVSQAHGAEQDVAPHRGRVLLHGVAASVRVRQQVQAAVHVSFAQRPPDGVQRRGPRESVAEHGSEGDDRKGVEGLRHRRRGEVRRRIAASVFTGEGVVRLGEAQDVQQDVAVEEAEEAPSRLVDDGEGVVGELREGLERVPHDRPRGQADDLGGHALVSPQRQHRLLRAELEEGHVPQLDVDVVDALVEEVPGPFRRHDGEENRDAPLGLAGGLHEDDGQGDGDPRHAR